MLAVTLLVVFGVCSREYWCGESGSSESKCSKFIEALTITVCAVGAPLTFIYFIFNNSCNCCSDPDNEYETFYKKEQATCCKSGQNKRLQSVLDEKEESDEEEEWGQIFIIF